MLSWSKISAFGLLDVCVYRAKRRGVFPLLSRLLCVFFVEMQSEVALFFVVLLAAFS